MATPLAAESCSLYRYADRDPVATLELIGAIGYRAVELFAGVHRLAVGSVDVAATQTDLGPRGERLHLEDRPVTADPTGPQTAVGDGRAYIAAAPQVDWHVTELGEYDRDPFDALARSYPYLVERGLSSGRSA